MRRKQIEAVKVNRMYEPNRLAQMHLERVYEQIIPKQVYVLQPKLKAIKSVDTSDKSEIKEYIG